MNKAIPRASGHMSNGPNYATLLREFICVDGDDFGRWRRFYSLTKHFNIFFQERIQVLLSQKIVSIDRNRLLARSSISIPHRNAECSDSLVVVFISIIVVSDFIPIFLKPSLNCICIAVVPQYNQRVKYMFFQFRHETL